MSEQCDRCGSVGEDRRTLWMACFYQMDELGLPFTQHAIRGRVREKVGDETKSFFGQCFKRPVWGEPQGDESDHAFFTIRVCKRCRAEWMEAIRTWFFAVPAGQDHDADEPEAGPGSGIFVRDGGAVREISREEWDRRYPGREPVVYRGSETTADT